MFFLSCDAVLEFYGSRPIHICEGRRDILPIESEERERVSENNKEHRETDSVLFCGGLFWIISVTRIKRLIN